VQGFRLVLSRDPELAFLSEAVNTARLLCSLSVHALRIFSIAVFPKNTLQAYSFWYVLLSLVANLFKVYHIGSPRVSSTRLSIFVRVHGFRRRAGTVLFHKGGQIPALFFYSSLPSSLALRLFFLVILPPNG
jgi:hypothetical protein